MSKRSKRKIRTLTTTQAASIWQKMLNDVWNPRDLSAEEKRLQKVLERDLEEVLSDPKISKRDKTHATMAVANPEDYTRIKQREPEFSHPLLDLFAVKKP